ncbi:MAG: hypothetical protein J07AB43_01410 [Candidatus Nanosalina sp. J07AB43]|jgi:hypothetical protein|nr:MAG: hypothetical protein J07AB43_01410 [Candidatus Nanosalina sp. J07AB43]
MTYDNTDQDADGIVDVPVDNESVSTREVNNVVNLNSLVNQGVVSDVGEAINYSQSQLNPPLKLTLEPGEHQYNTQAKINTSAVVLEGAGGGSPVSGGSIESTTELVWTGGTDAALKIENESKTVSGVDLCSFGLRPNNAGDGGRGIDIGQNQVRNITISNTSVSEFGDAGVAVGGEVFDYATFRLSLINNNANGNEAQYYEHSRQKLNDSQHFAPFWFGRTNGSPTAVILADLAPIFGGHLHKGDPCLRYSGSGGAPLHHTSIEGDSSTPYTGVGVHIEDCTSGPMAVGGHIYKWDTGVRLGVAGENHNVKGVGINADFDSIETIDYEQVGTGPKKWTIRQGTNIDNGGNPNPAGLLDNELFPRPAPRELHWGRRCPDY